MIHRFHRRHRFERRMKKCRVSNRTAFRLQICDFCGICGSLFLFWSASTACCACGFAVSLQRLVAIGSERRDVRRPARSDVSRFDQDETRTGHGTIGTELAETIQVCRVAADGGPRTNARVLWRCARGGRSPFHLNLTHVQPGELSLFSRIRFEDDVDHRAETVVKHEEVRDGFRNRWRDFERWCNWFQLRGARRFSSAHRCARRNSRG